MQDPVGYLRIVLGSDGAHLIDARPRHPQSVLVGRTVGEAAAILPRLFAVCGIAHGNAFARAVAAATGSPVDPDEAAARHRAEQMEVIANHAWRFAITWPQALDLDIRPTPLKAARDAQAADDPHAAAAALRALLDEPDGPVERMRDRARRLTGTPGLPTCRQPLGWPSAAWWAEAMRRPGFFDRPTALDDRVPAVLPRGADPGAKIGPLGIATALVSAARESLVRLCGPVDRASESHAIGPGDGVGLAETARGPLAYRVRVDGDRILEAAAVSPTDWLAVPEGSFGRALAALPGGAGQESRVRLMAGLYDPCVPVRIEPADIQPTVPHADPSTTVAPTHA